MPLLIAVFSAINAPAQTSRPAIAGRRIVKHFDFNERPLGNYDPTPMFWRRHSGEGFASFLEGHFDSQNYHAAAPSFRLDLNGSSVAYDYVGGDIAVRARSDYLITAWIRTAGLKTARAYVSACYLDRKKNPIPGTEVRSLPIGGGDAPSDWQAVTMGLPSNVSGARYIGLAMWLAQERVWNTGPRPPRTIEYEDVEGSAWFDDITVYRLPRVMLTSANPGQAFGMDADTVLLTDVSDPDGLNLSGSLILRSVDGVVVDERPVSLQPLDAAAPHAEVYKNLPMGLYRAELIVTTDGMPLARQELSFLRYPEGDRKSRTLGQGFGVVLHDTDPGGLSAQVDLVSRLGVEYVKLPVWRPRKAAGNASAQPAGRTPTGQGGVEKYLEALTAIHARPIGILASDGEELKHGRSVLDLLSGPAAAWRPLIASDWSRFAGLAQIWQLGEDHDEAIGSDERLARIVTALQHEMSALMSDPRLATPTRVGPVNQLVRPADYTSLVLPALIPPDEIDAHLASLIGTERQHTWITVEPPTPDAYAREPRLADLTRRLVEAAWQQPAAVFMDAPWTLHCDAETTRVETTEDFVILRTVAGLFGEATPVSRFRLDGHAHCILFDRNGRSVMLTWDPEAPAEGREYVLPLGEDAQHVDVWGRSLPIERAGDQQAVRIGPLPTIIANAPTWLLDFRHYFAAEGEMVEASLTPSQQRIVFRNPSSQPINGVLSLTGPSNWNIRPSKIPFMLGPNEEFRQAVTMHFPLNTPAEPTPLVGEFELEADRRYHFAVPAWFEVGLKGVELETSTYRTGDRSTVRLTVKNVTTAPVHFEAYLVTPGRERRTSLLTNCLPNQPITKTFALDKAAELSGRHVRLTLKELQGTRVWNRIIALP